MRLLYQSYERKWETFIKRLIAYIYAAFILWVKAEVFLRDGHHHIQQVMSSTVFDRAKGRTSSEDLNFRHLEAERSFLIIKVILVFFYNKDLFIFYFIYRNWDKYYVPHKVILYFNLTLIAMRYYLYLHHQALFSLIAPRGMKNDLQNVLSWNALTFKESKKIMKYDRM